MRTPPQARSPRKRLKSRNAGSASGFSEIPGSSTPDYASLRHAWVLPQARSSRHPASDGTTGSRRKPAANGCENVMVVKTARASARPAAELAKDDRSVLMKGIDRRFHPKILRFSSHLV